MIYGCSQPKELCFIVHMYIACIIYYCTTVSEEYRNIKMRGFDQLEEYCHDIVRRAHPYDRQYEK